MLYKESVTILSQLGDNALRHVILLWKDRSESLYSNHKNEMKKEIIFISENIKSIKFFLQYHHYELLFSPSKTGSIINTYFLNNFSFNINIVEKYYFTEKFDSNYCYYFNIDSSYIYSYLGNKYYVSIGVFAPQDTLNKNYYGMQDNAGLLSFNIVKATENIPRGRMKFSLLGGQRTSEFGEIIYTSSIFFGNESIFVTCLQQIKGYRGVHFEYKLYRYVFHIISSIGNQYGKKQIFSFSNSKHPCAWERDEFYGNYNNICEKRGFILQDEIYNIPVSNLRDDTRLDTDIINKIDAGLQNFYKL